MLVTVPNGAFSAMTLENLSRADKTLFHITLNLLRDTTAEQVRAVLESVGRTLRTWPKIEAGALPVRHWRINRLANVPDFLVTSARVCQERLKMPATSKQKGDLIRQHLQIERHLDEVAKILEITVSKLQSKIKAGSWWDLSQKDAKKVLDFLRTV